MPFEKIAEQKIRAAMEAGEFDDLPGAGQPVDLEGYFALPHHLRAAYAVLKNANCAPEEVLLLRDVARLERAVADAGDASPELHRELEAARLKLSVAMERFRREARTT
ncbi:MAG: DUF1992 domain-containing protein [Vicinamibacterales bacterium]